MKGVGPVPGRSRLRRIWRAGGEVVGRMGEGRYAKWGLDGEVKCAGDG